MAKGNKTKKKPKKAKRVESELNEATLDSNEPAEPVATKLAAEPEGPVAAKSAVSAAKSEDAKKPAEAVAKPEKPAKPVAKPLTRQERRAKRKAAEASGGADLEGVEDAGSGGALMFLGVIFSLLIVAIIAAMVTR